MTAAGVSEGEGVDPADLPEPTGPMMQAVTTDFERVDATRPGFASARAAPLSLARILDDRSSRQAAAPIVKQLMEILASVGASAGRVQDNSLQALLLEFQQPFTLESVEALDPWSARASGS